MRVHSELGYVLGCVAVVLATLSCVLPAVTCLPVVVNTWNFPNATAKAWSVLEGGGSVMETVVAGCGQCERDQCDGTVGYGGSPDEHGETTLDAMVMDGSTGAVGSVGSLRDIKEAIAVARAVMMHTKHTLLVGELATEFAVSMGFNRTSLSTNKSRDIYENWRKKKCQPNFWMNVEPDPSQQCGPYHPTELEANSVESHDHYHAYRYNENVDNHHHDTIGMVAVDTAGRVSVGTSTNGATHKIPGRVGDSPIVGAGGYADSDVGGAVATGDGDVMMRFVPSYLVVELMRQGHSPEAACRTAIDRIASHYPSFSGALLAVTKTGIVGAACHGLAKFPYCVHSNNMTQVEVREISCSGSK